MRKLIASVVIAGAVTGIQAGEPEARRPIHWKVGEYQQGGFDAIPGDTITVFYHRRNTPVNLEKCLHSGGEGLILVKWRGKTYEACPDVDF